MPKTQEPLTESYFYILLCLYQGPSHGYGIMQKTLELSDGQVRIGSGTMYGATANLMQKGWIQECPPSGAGFERKRMYRLTELGRQTVLQELQRLNHLTKVAAAVIGGVS